MVIITLNILKKKDNSNLDKNKIVFDIIKSRYGLKNDLSLLSNSFIKK